MGEPAGKGREQVEEKPARIQPTVIHNEDLGSAVSFTHTDAINVRLVTNNVIQGYS